MGLAWFSRYSLFRIYFLVFVVIQELYSLFRSLLWLNCLHLQDVSELRNELQRKDALVQKHLTKLRHWQQVLEDINGQHKKPADMPQGSLAYLEQASANIPAPMKQTWGRAGCRMSWRVSPHRHGPSCRASRLGGVAFWKNSARGQDNFGCMLSVKFSPYFYKLWFFSLLYKMPIAFVNQVNVFVFSKSEYDATNIPFWVFFLLF